ncbi:MAG TPA: oligosaccharide flippase family protein [Anaerolineaceae bacterium]|jgi:O-antigen/teichoic acid export membrane protein|nr:oligosaccharide flippase family protein [Anaerolineaceae bacterium]
MTDTSPAQPPGRLIKDRLLGRVVKNSTYLFASNAISAVLSIVTANLLGVSNFGVLGLVIGFVSDVNRLFSFRMGEVIVRYVGEALEQRNTERAAAVIKAAALTEAVTSLLAFGVLVLLAPLGARLFIKDLTAIPLIMLYGAAILGSLVAETANGVLQVSGHFRSQAALNLIQAVVTAGLILLAWFQKSGVLAVLWAYLAGKLIIGIGPAILAWRRLPELLGRDWLRVSFNQLPPRRELLRYAVATNFSGTINMIARDSEVMWVGFFFTPIEAGYFKMALSIVNLMIMPITPFISTTFPEITRAVAVRSWNRLRTLLQRVSIIAAGWTMMIILGLAFWGRQLLFEPLVTIGGHTLQLYTADYAPAMPVLFILLIGFGVANILFWNRPLLLALGQPGYSLKVGFWCMLSKVLLAVILLPAAGYLMEATLLSGYFLVSVSWMVIHGVKTVRRLELDESKGKICV